MAQAVKELPLAARETACDAVIVGGGLVGASLACALQDLRVAVVDDAAPADAAPAGFDSRIYAISPGNAAFLRQLGAWDRMPAGTVTPVHGMQVHGDDGDASIAFDAWDTGVAELAWIVEDRLLQHALREVLASRSGVELLAPARCEALAFGPERAALTLEDGRRLVTKLVVGADGASSFVRDRAGIVVRQRPYGYSAVVANFACGKAHGFIARQWFQGGPVLALLPLPGSHVSMVWSTHEAEAARLAALPAASLCGDVERASALAVGALTLVTPPRVFPLRRLEARESVRERLALVGDAAHVVHPLAGQGANLGFQDARVLARVLHEREPGRDPGDRTLLRRYERERAEAILTMSATVHGLFRLFGAGGQVAGRARNAGLKLVDRAGVIKNLLMRHAML